MEKEIILSPEDNDFVELFNSEVEKLSQKDQKLLFRNVLKAGPRCGFANSGVEAFLINTDKKNSYKITLKITECQRAKCVSRYKVYRMSAGYKRFLGCTRGASVGSSDYSFTVVGEEKVK